MVLQSGGTTELIQYWRREGDGFWTVQYLPGDSCLLCLFPEDRWMVLWKRQLCERWIDYWFLKVRGRAVQKTESVRAIYLQLGIKYSPNQHFYALIGENVIYKCLCWDVWSRFKRNIYCVHKSFSYFDVIWLKTWKTLGKSVKHEVIHCKNKNYYQ